MFPPPVQEETKKCRIDGRVQGGNQEIPILIVGSEKNKVKNQLLIVVVMVIQRQIKKKKKKSKQMQASVRLPKYHPSTV
jgi:hypothetical protein